MKYLIYIFLSLFIFTACQPKPQQTTQKNNSNTNNRFVRNLTAEPDSLHPIRSTDAFAKVIFDHVLDTLIRRNLDTFEWDPYLAEKWTISEDGKTFIFTIRKDVKWHDGKPLTVQDVVFSFKAHKDPSFGGARYISYFEHLESATILDEHRVQFKASETYMGHLEVLGETMRIIPEHIYKDKEKKLKNSLLGSGPYKLKRYDKGKQIILEQNKNWWGRTVKSNSHRIKTIIFKFIENENDQLIRMASGDLDFIGLLPESYFKKTNKEPWGKTVFKKKIENKAPGAYSFVAWNLKNPLFQDRKVRRALAYLANRKLMNEKFQYNQARLATGPWYPWNEFADPNVKPIPFDPEQARKLLKEAGWEDTDKNGVLDKVINNQKTEFRFTLIFPTKDFEKYYTLYQEDLKKSGIDISLRFMDWQAFIKKLQSKNFNAMSLAWITYSTDQDPKQIWHSESAIENGSNFISYSNPLVDQLIDSARIEMDKEKRIPILRQVYRIIADEAPYLFLFSNPVRFYAHSNKVKMEKDTYNYGVGLQYWQISNE